MFSVVDDSKKDVLMIGAIHDDSGFRQLRQSLSYQYNLSMNEPNIQVWSVNLRGDRSITLRHVRQQGRPLADTSSAVLKHLHYLWKFDVHLECWEESRLMETISCTADGIKTVKH
jgi:spore cortex formation protein SpoVR/YcgB (stage V sporulation)